ncbi:glycosyltransferase family 2 protein [Microbacterium sp. M28]|uniref:glycosyltransferase family A protein n=1 Tax=Microbacterium sp. M28 TaxID=2962064 RepID=UPI0021F42DD8|nr:glycosyltransferase family A protein [Microbacterium sp. M28]UYO98169.1 glycosyltransferase family 2 protein [Microbacterium sp. M28]
MTPLVDVLVPVHSPTRPVRRLVASVLPHTKAPVRILVIAHNTPVEGIHEALGEWIADERVEVIAFRDGTRSPAGPLREGLGRVSAPYFTKIDSDDHLAPGAIDAWLETARRHRADIIIPRMTEDAVRGGYPTPPRRAWRWVLDPVRDRLAYRTSTMGLLASGLADAASPTLGLAVGEDIVPSIALWFSGARVARAPWRAAYHVGSDAVDRTTAKPRPLEEELAFIGPLLEAPVWRRIGEDERSSIGAKVLRVHLSGSARRGAAAGWQGTDALAVAEAAARLAEAAPGMRRSLSRLDDAFLDALLAPEVDPERIGMAALRRGSYLRPGALIPSRSRDLLRTDAPLRFLSASTLARLRG